MRKTLDGYDTKYRVSTTKNQSATDVAVGDLVKAITMQWFWWIACLDENGNRVARYTNNVVLELKDDTPPEKVEEAKKLTARVLETMWASEKQIQDVLDWNPENE